MLLSYIIDTQEERCVVVIDIPNAFIQILIDHEKYMAIIKIRRILVDTLIDIVPDVYGPYVPTNSKRIKQLIAHRMNAIYGTMVSIIIYY